MPNSANNKRVAKNTMMLYFRQILILLVSLYTVRVVLNALGIEDYGIYNVVGGIVTFFSFLSGTMASATQRFFSFALGQNDPEKLKKTFTVNWIIYGVIAVIALILLETVGLWFVDEQLKLPVERFEAAQLIYHYSVLTFVATIITSPFMAIIIAHEDMHIYAYVSVIEAGLKLGIVWLLMVLPKDKLELYGILVFVVSIINALMYVVICTQKYLECQFREFFWDKELLHEITGFTGWTLFGQITSVVRNQAVTILLNQMFNPVVVAARAISTNIANQINLFSSNFNVGLYPPIIKSYAAGDKEEMFSLIFNGSKITFFLMWVFALPVFLEMDTILNVWLKNPPFEAVLFTRLALTEVLVNSISLPLTTAARAPGKMKTYELTLGIIQLLVFLISWVVLKMGGEAYTVFVVALIINLIMFLVRLLIVKTLIGFSFTKYISQVIIPMIFIMMLTSVISFAVHLFLPRLLFFTCVSIFLSMTTSLISMYYIGLSKEIRKKIKDIIMFKIDKVYTNLASIRD